VIVEWTHVQELQCIVKGITVFTRMILIPPVDTPISFGTDLLDETHLRLFSEPFDSLRHGEHPPLRIKWKLLVFVFMRAIGTVVHNTRREYKMAIVTIPLFGEGFLVRIPLLVIAIAITGFTARMAEMTRACPYGRRNRR